MSHRLTNVLDRLFVLGVLERLGGRTLQKCYELNAPDDWPPRKVYDHGREKRGELYMHRLLTAESPEELVPALRGVVQCPQYCLVAGQIRPEFDASIPQRRYFAKDLPGHLRVIGDADRRCLVADIDEAPVPAPLGRPEHLHEAILYVSETFLPEELRDVTAVWALSPSTGFKGDTLFSVRCYFPLTRSYPLAQLRNWIKNRQEAGYPLDWRVILAGQWIYTSRPICRGFTDPFSVEQFAFIVPGTRDCAELGDLSSVTTSFDQALRPTGDDAWREFIDVHYTGKPLGCHDALLSGIGMAVRRGVTWDQVLAFYTELAAERATPEKLRQYSPAKVHEMYRYCVENGARSQAEAARVSRDFYKRFKLE